MPLICRAKGTVTNIERGEVRVAPLASLTAGALARFALGQTRGRGAHKADEVVEVLGRRVRIVELPQQGRR